MSSPQNSYSHLTAKGIWQAWGAAEALGLQHYRLQLSAPLSGLGRHKPGWISAGKNILLQHQEPAGDRAVPGCSSAPAHPDTRLRWSQISHESNLNLSLKGSYHMLHQGQQNKTEMYATAVHVNSTNTSRRDCLCMHWKAGSISAGFGKLISQEAVTACFCVWQLT